MLFKIQMFFKMYFNNWFYFFLKAISKREFNGKVLASSLLAANRVKGKAAVKIYDQEEFSHY